MINNEKGVFALLDNIDNDNDNRYADNVLLYSTIESLNNYCQKFVSLH